MTKICLISLLLKMRNYDDMIDNGFNDIAIMQVVP